jgi:hypothetical protein
VLANLTNLLAHRLHLLHQSIEGNWGVGSHFYCTYVTRL